MSKPVSVVVGTRSRGHRLVDTVPTLLADSAVLEVVVVVDGSRDGSFEALERAARDMPALRPVRQEHAGAGAARQRGAEAARGNILLLLDDDVVPPPGLASAHERAHAEHPGHIVVGALETPRRPPGVDAITTELYREAWEHCRREYERHPETVLEHLWLGNVSLSKDDALRVGLDDPEMGALYFEDRDLGLRLRAHNIPAVFRSDLGASHDHRRSLAAFRDDAVRQGRAMGVLHRRYPELVPAPTPRWIAGRAPWPTAWVLAASARLPGFGVAVAAVLLRLGVVLGKLRLWVPQRLVVVLLQRVGQMIGASARSRQSRWSPPTVPDAVLPLLLPASGGHIGPWRRTVDRSRVTAVYETRRGWAGANALVPVGNPACAAALTGPRLLPAVRRIRRLALDAAHTVRGRPKFVLEAPGAAPPAVVAAALGAHAPAAMLLFGGGGPRRRAVFVVPEAGAVVKVAAGLDATMRAEHEQDVLMTLHQIGVGVAVPRPLGHGMVEEIVWSAESAAMGVPLAELLAESSPRNRHEIRRVLQEIVDWLAEVGTASRRPGEDSDPLALHVLQHGDLASGFNLLVDGAGFMVIDWETADRRGYPLADVLPLLAGALAAGQGGPAEQAEYVLRLCAGREADSAWFLGVVAGYCRRVCVPAAAVGVLADHAWRRQANMQRVHRRLAAEFGTPAPAWDSPWDLIADEWLVRRGLGATWTVPGCP